MNIWEVLLAIFWFMLLVAWFWLMITIITDIFRDDDMSGVAKAAWCIFVVLLPWLGVLVYMLARGRSMAERAQREGARNERAFRSYVRDAAQSGTSVAEELAQLAQLRNQGTITQEEYEQAKQRVLGGPVPPPSEPAPATAGVPTDLRA